MTHFNDDGIIVGALKQLLKSVNLPACHVWKPGDRVFKDSIYVHKTNIYKCLQSGKFTSLDKSAFKDCSFYVLNEFIPNLTKNLVTNTTLYDVHTHEYLGNFLRFVRDYLDIDLMSLYNCFNNQLITNLKINTTYVANDSEVKINFDSDDLKYKIYAIPVKFDKKYTIALNCTSKIEVVCGLYADNMLDTTNSTNTLFINTYKKYAGLKLNKPVVYDKLEAILDAELDANKLYTLEDNLKLFIKIPAEENSSVVVFEGDCSSNGSYYFKDNSIYPSFATVINDYASMSQLLKMNSEVSYPFADKLIEYILGCAITDKTRISDNIAKVQQSVKDENIIENYYPQKGIWDNKLRPALYQAFMNDKSVISKYDVLGYVDKDVESTLIKDLDVE